VSRRLLIGFVLALCCAPSIARAQVKQNINFDDLGGVGVRPVAGNRYASQGVRLETTGAGFFVYNSALAKSAPDWLYASQTPNGGNADSPITIRFVSPVDGTPAVTEDVAFSIADGDAVGEWSIEAFDVNNVSLGIAKSTTATSVHLTSRPFHRLVFTPSGDFEGIDSLVFNNVSAPTDLAFITPIAFGSKWRYLHPLNNVNPATTDADFNTTWYRADASYNGPAFSAPLAAPLGYGTIDLRALATNIGTPASGARNSAYFTTTFNIDNADLVRTLSVDLLADDGAFIYLNGNLVARHNMLPNVADTYTQTADGVDVDGVSTEQATFRIDLNPDFLVSGTNVISVSIHNDSTGSSDLGFDLAMYASVNLVPEPSTYALFATAALSMGVAARRRRRRAAIAPDFSSTIEGAT
jgi:hypothetical protein